MAALARITQQGTAHGDLDCGSVENLLKDADNDNLALAGEVEALRAENRVLVQADALRQVDMDVLLSETARFRSLLQGMRKKAAVVADGQSGDLAQIEMLLSELDTAEAAAVPVGTFTFATVSTAEVSATYRRVSRITRGPIPPVVAAALGAAKPEIEIAMAAAAAVVVDKVVRREVRRRRRGRNVTARRQRARRAK